MPSRGRYDSAYEDGMPVGVSFVLFVMGVIALWIAVVYLQASLRHEREHKISEYEQTVAKWKRFRGTFSRLSVNVTAHFGVAPANTSDPGLDLDPPPPGEQIALSSSDDPDPIRDEEGPEGDLPAYVPLKYEEGVAPAPWRTAPRYPQSEDSPEDEHEGEATAGDGGDGNDASPEVESEDEQERDSVGNTKNATSSGAGGGRRRLKPKRRRASGALLSPPRYVESLHAGESDGRSLSGEAGRRMHEADDDGEGEGEAASEGTLPEAFLPRVSFEEAPSVKFVFAARLEPKPREQAQTRTRREGKNKARGTGGGKDAKRRRLLWHWRQLKKAGRRARAPLEASMETDWTPLTRIREEHAPMPAPETKCMQVFGGIHNYKTKMCEVYERLSRACVQIQIHEGVGLMDFAPVAEVDATSDEEASADGLGERDSGSSESAAAEAAVSTPRYGCDPRKAWSPWSYAVLPVEGRTVLDVVPPPSVSFVETLVTVRSDLDPFLRAEALTYTPSAGGSVGGGGGGSWGGVDAGGGARGGRDDVQTDGTAGGSGQFLTFGLSSWSCAVVGCLFLVVGTLLLVQPLCAIWRWRRQTLASKESGGPGAERDRGIVYGSGKPRGHWRYGQVGTEWGDDSEYSYGDAHAQEDHEWRRQGSYSRQASSGLGMPTSPSEGHSDADVARADFSADSLRRRLSDLTYGSKPGESAGIQMGLMKSAGVSESRRDGTFL